MGTRLDTRTTDTNNASAVQSDTKSKRTYKNNVFRLLRGIFNSLVFRFAFSNVHSVTKPGEICWFQLKFFLRLAFFAWKLRLWVIILPELAFTELVHSIYFQEVSKFHYFVVSFRELVNFRETDIFLEKKNSTPHFLDGQIWDRNFSEVDEHPGIC